jgi:RNA polymerase sigma factor (sigma-70 family)
MQRVSAPGVLGGFQTLYASGTLLGLSDADLLDRFVSRGGREREDAFTVLVQRHGPMVLQVCRRMLRGSADADDAVQAVFLVLARRAGALREADALSSWLYGVAIRTAKQARREAARRQAREARAMAEVRTRSATDSVRDELLSLLDEELDRLPTRYRDPVRLCELEGRSRRDAAEELGLPEGTLSSRLSRGRALLRERLVRRGVAPGVGALATVIDRSSDASLAEPLVRMTVAHALDFAAGSVAAGTVPQAIAALAKGVLARVVGLRLKLGAFVAVACITLAGLMAVPGFAGKRDGHRAGDPQTQGAAASRPGASSVSLQSLAAAKHHEDTPKEPDVSLVRGTVVDERGQPVAGAEVRVEAFEPVETWGITAADGSFSVPSGRGLRDGATVLARSADGRRVGLFAFPWFVQAREAVEASARVVLKPMREVLVRVTDGRGVPVPGATVEAAGSFWNLDEATTGPDGSARLRIPPDARVEWIWGLKPGLGFDFAEFGPAEGHNRPRAGVPVGELPGSVPLVLDRPTLARIKALDRDGKPLSGVGFTPCVLAREGRQSTLNLSCARFVAKTDADGIATFDWLPPAVKGRGALQFMPITKPYANFGVLVHEGETTTVTTHLVRTETLRGRVRFPDGSPAPGITVLAQGVGRGLANGCPRVRTSADGSYAMELSPDKVYAVSINDKDWTARTRLDVAVQEGQPVAPLDFQLGPGTVLRGTVTLGGERKPVANALIRLVESSRQRAPAAFRDPGARTAWLDVRRQFGTSTDPEGRYALRLGPGTFTLTGPPYTKSETITVTNEPEILRNFAMPRPDKGPLSGKEDTGVGYVSNVPRTE